MGISASSIDLLVAVSGLIEVQDVVSAMRAADASQAKRGLLGLNPCIEPRQVVHPEPRYEPRPVIHPEPRYEPRPVYHPEPRIEPRDLACGCGEPPPQIVVKKADTEQPLEAPWKSVPWKTPLPPAPKVKLAPPHPDIGHKGLLLDFFV